LICLVRVDERLIHGQVVVGWSALEATVYSVVNEQLAESDWERDLVLAGVPDDAAGEAVTVAAAAGAWEQWTTDCERRMILLEDVSTAVELLEAGASLDTVNVGGMHGAADRRELLSYVQLDSDQIDACRRLCRAGVRLLARDLPGTSAVDLCALIGERG
jgi:mannose/fructose/N-acetylgalactosamine-specific phosphotransferase system component IIB